jgi:hypothetical protein
MSRKEVCDSCGSHDIRQEATFMIDPNDPKHEFNPGDATYQDYYHCMDCGDECGAEYVDTEKLSEKCSRENCPVCG